MDQKQHTYYDKTLGANNITILPGGYGTTGSEDDMLMTLLGSCVAACIRDPIAKVGGLNHFLLAEPSIQVNSPSNRYGVYAMECLINDILKKGGVRERLEVKVFGGADLFGHSNKVGTKNVIFIREFLRREGLKLLAEDLGGNRPRRIHFWPHSGKVMRLILPEQADRGLIMQENEYSRTLQKEKVSGSVELF